MAKKIKIYSDKPMPEKRSTRYPWDRLKSGESFKVQGKTNGRALCILANKTYAPKRFKSHMISGEVWVWRVE